MNDQLCLQALLALVGAVNKLQQTLGALPLAVANGGTGTTTTLTAGSVVFATTAGVYSQDNSNLFWDDTNNRLGLGTASPNATNDVNGTVGWRQGPLTLANGANSDITLPTNSWVRITGPSGAFSVSGFAGPFDGRRLILFNSTAQNMTITNDATSTAANRILTLTGADVVLTATSLATFLYSTLDLRWILQSTQG